MIRSLLSAAALLVVLSAPALAAEALPLKRVTLSTSGLAQFEYHGAVTGDATLSLPVRLDQVDDVLKSLVVLDDGGSFGGVSLPGREPLDTIFRDLPFDADALRSPETLLASLQGAEVQINGVETIRGKLVSIVPEQSVSKDGHAVRHHRITVMSADGLRSAILEDLKSLSFTEANVQDQVNRALKALHDHRVQDQREIALDLRGEGSRQVSVSYVTAAPVWKSAYRLVLPAADSKTAYMQGWAILENTTGQDWDDVAITLLSGNPVTYKQALYESYYRDRPILPLRVMDRLMPRTDTGGTIAEFSRDESRKAEADYGSGAGASRMLAKSAAPMAPAPAMEMMAMADSAEGMAGQHMNAAPMQMAATQTAIAEQAVAQMVFRFPQAVTLRAGSSMMLPVISRDIPAEAVFLYQPDTHARHPLSAVAVTNNTGGSLPPGILTLFEQGGNGLRYSGDSELALMPDGETRYVTFALDPATTIDREIRGDRRYGSIKAAKGIVTQKIVSSEETLYTIAAPKTEGRTIVIEHPRRAGWDLQPIAEIDGTPEKTETHYRLKFTLPPGETRKVTLVLERQEWEHISLGYMSPSDMQSRITAAGNTIDAAARKALDGAIALQNDVYATQSQINRVEQERQNIFNDQQRLRDNIKSIPAGSDVAKRYLAQLNTQEDRLAKLAADTDALGKKLAEAQRKLAEYVAKLDL